MDSFGQVLCLGWVYLATKGIIPLDNLMKARKSNEMVTSGPD
jgi:hypothetical protein